MENKKKVFESYKINNKLELRNRLVMAPMTTWSGNGDGSVSEAELKYYRHRSEGVGAIITATTYLEPHGKGFSGQFYGGEDETLPSLKALADTIHKGGAKAILQVFHAGRKANPKDMPDGLTVSASNVAAKRTPDNVPRTMTEEEILSTIDAFRKSVKRAYEAGFDGVEIHGANTYLLQQFYSPHSNYRIDRWGGDRVERYTFLNEVIQACLDERDKLSKEDFIVGYRFSPEENSNPGITLEDTDYLIDRLCESDLDYLHISLADYRQTSIRDEKSTEIILERAVKRINHRKPFIGVGSVYKMQDAQMVLDYGAEIVALGRQLLIDGKSVEKWASDQLANELYSPQRREEEHIPSQLHDRIMKTPNWVPKKE